MRLVLAAVFAILAHPALPEPAVCDSPIVQIGPSAANYAGLICEAATHAEQLFESCNLPLPPNPVRINIVDEMIPGCLAQFHCGENRIELLAPPSMEAVRSDEGAFARVPTEELFRSIVVHELAHAAFDHFPCPFASCSATTEYVAYVMQIMSLAPDTRVKFAESAELDGSVSHGDLSQILLYMAPGRFAQKAWVHFTEREDPCGYMALIAEGAVLFDRDRF